MVRSPPLEPSGFRRGELRNHMYLVSFLVEPCAPSRLCQEEGVFFPLDYTVYPEKPLITHQVFWVNGNVTWMDAWIAMVKYFWQVCGTHSLTFSENSASVMGRNYCPGICGQCACPEPAYPRCATSVSVNLSWMFQ